MMRPMDLDAYLTREGVGAHARLARTLKIRWQTLQDIRQRRTEPRLRLAVAISDATDGAVAPRDLLKPAPKRRGRAARASR